MQDLKQKVLENLKTKGYHEYQLKELNPIIQATIEATKQALNIADISGRSEQLKAFFLWFRENGELHLDKSIEKMIDVYLKSL